MHICESMLDKIIKVLVVEDHPLTARDLSEILSARGMVVTGMAKNHEEALLSVGQNVPDVLLVDVKLKDGDDGIDLVEKILPEKCTPIIYLTANSDKETVDRALRTKPAAFLTKPYDEKDLVIAIEVAFNNHCMEILTNEVANSPFVFLKAGNKFEKVRTDEINYLEADGSYSKFITREKEYFLSGNLNQVSTKLGNPAFIRVHRSFVVNIDSVTGLDNNYVFIGEKAIPVSRSYRADVDRSLRKII